MLDYKRDLFLDLGCTEGPRGFPALLFWQWIDQMTPIVALHHPWMSSVTDSFVVDYHSDGSRRTSNWSATPATSSSSDRLHFTQVTWLMTYAFPWINMCLDTDSIRLPCSFALVNQIDRMPSLDRGARTSQWMWMVKLGLRIMWLCDSASSNTKFQKRNRYSNRLTRCRFLYEEFPADPDSSVNENVMIST